MSASAPSGAPGPLTSAPAVWQVFDAWLRRASALIGESADALDALNVFPVSDADTGTNLTLTLAGITRAAPEVSRTGADAVVQAAILSAHGSSGAIVAEMFTSVCRSLEHGQRAAVTPPGRRVASLLRAVSDAASAAVSRPVAGTILTVAEDAARAAEQAASADPDDVLAVARAAQAEAHAALQRTPAQLPALAAAGVVDAGAQAYTLLVDALVEVLGGPPARPLPAPAPHGGPAPPLPGGPDYEVMYVLRGAGAEALAALREKLSDLGHSVVVVGEDGGSDAGVASVHVHLAEPGAAVEAALGVGTLSQIRITALEPRPAGTRSVVAVVAGAGTAATVRQAGAVPVLAEDGQPVVDELRRVLLRLPGDVVVLPNDMETLEAAGHLVAELRAERRTARPGRRLAVVPTVAQVQGLAALAVHEPTADFDAAVAAMSAAVGHARHGAVTVAEAPTMTVVGRCRPGEVLGVVEGDVAEVGRDLLAVAERVVERLLAAGGELLTVVPGRDVPDGLVAALIAAVRRDRPHVEVQVVGGGQPRYPLLLGAE